MELRQPVIVLLAHRALIPHKAQLRRLVLVGRVPLVPFPVFLAPAAASHVLQDDIRQSSADHCVHLVKLALQDLILHQSQQLQSKLVCSVLQEHIQA